MKKILIAFSLSLYSIMIIAQCQLNLNYSNLNLVFSDEFNDNSIANHLTKWDSAYSWGPFIGSDDYRSFNYTPVYTCYRDQTHVIHDGVVDLFIKKSNPEIPNTAGKPYYHAPRGNKNYKVSSSLIRSKYNEVIAGNNSTSGFQYGIVEVRCKMPANGSTYPCIWLCSPNKPAYAQAIREGWQGMNGFITYAQFEETCPSNGNSGSCGIKGEVKFPNGTNIDDRYHTYHMVWTPSTISYYFDGRQFLSMPAPPEYSTSCSAAGLKMDLIIDMEYNYWVNGVLSDNTDVNFLPNNWEPISVDYVRIYKPVNNNWTNLTYNKDSYRAWNSFNDQIGTEINLNGTNVALQSISSDYPGQAFYKGTDNLMWNVYESGGTWASQPLSWTINDVAGDVGVDNGVNRIYYRNTLGLLKYFSWNGSGYNNVYDGVVNNMAGWIEVDRNLHKVYYLGTDGKIWNYYWNGTSYTKNVLGSNTNVSGWIRVSANGQKVYYRGTDGYLWRYIWNGSNWVNQQLLTANNVAGGIVVESNDRVYYRGTDNYLWNWDGSGTPYIGRLTNDPGMNNCTNDMTFNPQGVFYRGTDQRLWHYYWMHDRWYYEVIDWNKANVTGVVTSATGTGSVFYLGSPVSGSANTIWKTQPWICNNSTYYTCGAGGQVDFYKTEDEDFGQREIPVKYAGSTPILQAESVALQADIFPNPNNGYFSIQCSDVTSLILCEVSNYLGQKVYETTFRSSNQFELTNQPPGLYVVKLRNLDDPGTELTKRMIVEK